MREADFAKTVKPIGKEKIDGKSAFHLRSDDVDLSETSDGQQFTIQSMGLWVDRAVPESKMSESFKQLMRKMVSGGPFEIATEVSEIQIVE